MRNREAPVNDDDVNAVVLAVVVKSIGVLIGRSSLHVTRRRIPSVVAIVEKAGASPER